MDWFLYDREPRHERAKGYNMSYKTLQNTFSDPGSRKEIRLFQNLFWLKQFLKMSQLEYLRPAMHFYINKNNKKHVSSKHEKVSPQIKTVV